MKTEKSSAIHRADKAFSLYIRARDPKCVTCGAATTDCSHIFRRTHHATRWNPLNAAGQCRRCHFIHHNQTESYLHDYARRKLGARRYDALRIQWETISSFKPYQLEEMARYFVKKYQNLLTDSGKL